MVNLEEVDCQLYLLPLFSDDIYVLTVFAQFCLIVLISGIVFVVHWWLFLSLEFRCIY